jgi:hypothetical protein
MSPDPTRRPESMFTASTMPGRSALTITPWTASTLPMAVSDVAHSTSLALIVVTASGGGCQPAPWAMAARI